MFAICRLSLRTRVVHSRAFLHCQTTRRTPTTTLVIRSSATKTIPSTPKHRTLLQTIAQRPWEYASIPCVAAFVGILTNYMGVKMLFYPIEYTSICFMDYKRWPHTPYGLFGWQGVVPCKTEPMATRLVDIVTNKLLSLPEAFGKLDMGVLTTLLLPALEESIQSECGAVWYTVLKPILPQLVTFLLTQLQNDIDNVLDLHQVVLSQFVNHKDILVDLFQKVGRVELEFLVNSGFGFGFGLGLLQMALWVRHPHFWTLPLAGALVGYVTNWIAIKLLFEPAEPVDMVLFELQGLFESRQIEVSDEFGDFMKQRVLNPQNLLTDLSNGADQGELFEFLRSYLPYPIPSHILSAAVQAIQNVAQRPDKYPELHRYVSDTLDIDYTLSSRLKLLSPTEFEDLLHPVFQEDEITLIVTGGVLGLIAGGLQTRLGWGGRGTKKAIGTIVGTLLASSFFFAHQKYEEIQDEPLASTARPHLLRRETILRIKE